MRLLLVEDEPDLLATLAQALREEGYAVDTAADGEDGLFKAEGAEYDAIVLDVMLPRMDGFDVLKRLRRSRKTPVLMLTARGRVDERVHGLNLGADDYLAKPFDLTEVFARLRALIRRSAGEARNVMAVGDLKINTRSKTVTKAGEAVMLTAREFSLLEYLALRRGKVVSRTELYEHLFDENDTSLSHLLDVHVSNIRKKLGHDLIATRRGQGYCIDA